MKKLNLLLCATTVLSCASVFCMQNADKIMGVKTGIAGKQYDTARSAQMLALKDAFIEKYGITPRELVHGLKVRPDLTQKYVEYARKKMDKFANITDTVEKRSKLANKIVRHYVKTGDLYVGIALKDKKDHYKNFKKEILIVIPRMGLDKKFIMFPRYGYTGKANKTVKKDTVNPATNKSAKKPVVTQKPIFIKETEIKVWEVKQPNKPLMPATKQTLTKPALQRNAAMVAQNDEAGMYPVNPSNLRPRPEDLKPLLPPTERPNTMLAIEGDTEKFRFPGEPEERKPFQKSSVMLADDVENPEWDDLNNSVVEPQDISADDDGSAQTGGGRRRPGGRGIEKADNQNPEILTPEGIEAYDGEQEDVQ